MAWEGAAAMDEAADRAFEELMGLRRNATEEQNQGMDTLVQWLARWFRTAGYKRLCRPLITSKRGEG